MPLPSPTAYPVLVIGGGISGLACAYHLQQAGIPVRVLEAGNRPGGVIATGETEGFRYELGPQSFLASEPLASLVDAVGLRDQLLQANPRAPRYILLGGKLVPAPLSPPALLKSNLLSAGTKWRLMTEITRHSKPSAEDESIASFVRRKFGSELLDRLVAPFVSGVYAGDPERLSMRASFPKVHELELKYGSVLRGAMKSRPAKGTPRAGLCSFRDGMESLPRAIAARLGDSLLLETRVTGVSHGKANGKPWLEVGIARNGQHETLEAGAVVVATPTYIASEILHGLSDKFEQLFSQIEYAPVAVVSACYCREQIQRSPDGFGFLVPRGEGLNVLGTVFSSSLFAGRVQEGMAGFACFAGGATNPKFCERSDEEITETICGELARVLGITGKPVAANVHRYPRALPQYNLGHTKIIQSLEELTTVIPGLFLAGNYLSGPSLSACVEQAYRTAEKTQKYLASVG